MSMFQSTWGQPAQPQQPQQQQAQPSAFGQPSTFGTPSAFGGGGAFGQPQQQQPQANPMFGGTATTTAAPAQGFGAFGGGQAQASSVFGASKPATGFGAFGGGTGAFGGAGGTFGAPAAAPAAAGGIFGGGANTGAFGGNAGGSVFGGAKPTFGGTTTQVAAIAPVGGYPAVAPITTGTSTYPWQGFPELDGASKITYQSITSQEPYRGCSFEELRAQDYSAGRKTAPAGGVAPATGAFGQSTGAFGGAQPAAQTSLFGQAQQPQQQGSMFGGGGTFGQPAAAPATTSAFGAFGQPAAAPAAGTGMFGGGGTTSAFGQPGQTSAFGSFGQPQQAAVPAATGSIFGGGGAFGAPKPATTGAFGGFGGTPAAAAAPTAFGQPAAPQGGAFGAFGGAQAAKPSIFGAPAAAPATGSIFGGGGAFGQTQQQPAQQPAGSLFGGGGAFGQQNQQQQPATSLFGQPAQPAQQPAGSLFGGGGGATSLFGQSTQQQQPQQNAFGGTGLFGAKPAAPAGGIFGQPANNGTGQTSLFGAPASQNNGQQPATGSIFGGGSGMFGAKPAAPQQNQGSSIFGQSFGGNNSTNGQLMNGNNNNGQGTLTASISQPIGVNLPIFSMLPTGPRSVDAEQSTKKKASFFVDVPTRSPIPRLQLGYTPANTKLRGFASTSNLNGSRNGGNPFSASFSFSSGQPNALSLSRNDLQQTDAFLGRSSGPSLGSGARQSVKKLILDKKIEPSELFSRSGNSPARGGSPKVAFSPMLSVAAREREAIAANVTDSPTAPVRAQPTYTPNKFGGRESTREPESAPDGELKEGDYWSKPSMDVLKKLDHTQLSQFEGLTIGRVSYGEITFLEPVDLTGLNKLAYLFGDVVRFDDKECTVYPDVEDHEKPPYGSGLNVTATISIERCWALDKGSREPIKDPKHPAAARHLKRLMNMRDTKFVGFDYEKGMWTFTVEHF